MPHASTSCICSGIHIPERWLHDYMATYLGTMQCYSTREASKEIFIKQISPIPFSAAQIALIGKSQP